MNGKKKFKLILILGMLSAIGPFSIDMYLAGFPAIAKDLNTTISTVALSLSSFFIGISIGQIFYGPLLDRFGRKKPLYVGLIIYFIASIGCMLATSGNALIWLRFLQALGSCAGMVASRAMVRDLFPVEDNAKVFSLLMLVVGVSPIIAPTLGGFLTAEYNWRYVFAVLSIMSLVVLIATHFLLPESRKPDKSISLKPKDIIAGFITVGKVPQFYTYACAGAVAAAGLYSYIAGSPQVFMQLFHVTEKQYGLIFASIAGGLITCSQFNSLLLRKYASQKIVLVAQSIQLLAGIALVIGSIMNWYDVYSTIGLCFCFLCCQGFIFPNTAALSMAPFSKNAGTASALLGSIQLGIGATTSAIVSYFSNGTAIPMTSVMAACACTSFIILLLGSKIIKSKTDMEKVQEEAAEMIMTS